MTYKKPHKNRMTVNNQKFLTKLEIIVNTKDTISETMMTHLLPFTSPRYPQRCDEDIIPAKTTELKIPLSSVLKFKSYSATGSTNEMLSVSSKSADKTAPLNITRK